MATNVAGALLHEFLSNALLLEGDETKVLRCVVFALVYRSDDLGDVAVLTEMLLYLILSDPRVGELPHIDLTRLDIRLLDCDTFPLKLRIRNC